MDRREGLEKEVLTGNILASEREILRSRGIITIVDDIDSCTAFDFIQDMTILSGEGREEILLLISSGGGSVDFGLAFIRAIKKAQAKGKKVYGHVYGQAMSMAFLVLQCCDVRIMGSGDILMMHGITEFTHGDIKNLDSEQKLLKSWQQYFSKLISSRCNLKYDEVYWHQVLADRTPQYYASDECKEMGLIDIVE